jgi:hypothetical protein
MKKAPAGGASESMSSFPGLTQARGLLRWPYERKQLANQILNPLVDTRWLRFVSLQAASSAFHSPEWLEALHRTYGYEPVAFATSGPDGELIGGLLLCRVHSPLTGRRLVSLPFSDHCEALVGSADELTTLLAALKREAETGEYKYIELRPLSSLFAAEAGLEKSDSFCYHKLNLSLTASELFRGFHKDCVQRKIHRAEREGLAYEEGRSVELLRKFYRLQVITRRRLQVPPQPFAWFRNLAECMGEKLNLRVASKDGTPVAAIITLQHGHSLVYKYGASDRAFSSLGGTQLLFWRAVEDAKSQGLWEFDLGRADWENKGLIRFKDQLGAARSSLQYYRHPAPPPAGRFRVWAGKKGHWAVSHLPDWVLVQAGNLFYKHLG